MSKPQASSAARSLSILEEDHRAVAQLFDGLSAPEDTTSNASRRAWQRRMRLLTIQAIAGRTGRYPSRPDSSRTDDKGDVTKPGSITSSSRR